MPAATWMELETLILSEVSEQRQILNPLNKARDRTHVLMDASQIH